MKLLIDFISKEVVVEADDGELARTSYDDYHMACNHVRTDDTWMSDISRMFDERVSELILHTMKIGAAAAMEMARQTGPTPTAPSGN